MSFERAEKELLTDDLIKQDIFYQFKNDGHIAVNTVLCAVSIFLVFLFSFLSPYAWIALVIPISLLVFSYRIKTPHFKLKCGAE